MKKLLSVFCFLVLVSVQGWGKPSSHTLTSLNGTFLGIKNNTLSIRTSQNTQFTIPLANNVSVASPSGSYSFLWLLPGDGIEVLLNNANTVTKIISSATWTFGTVAFTSPDRLTLLEGPQFFLDQTPLFFNGEKIAELSELQPPNEVLVRFDPLGMNTVSIWGFNPEEFKESSYYFPNHSRISTSIQGNKLVVGVRTEPLGKVTAQLLGATHKFPLLENPNGHYEASLSLPPKIAIPKTYLQLEWRGILNGKKLDEKWIYAKPISLYTENPLVLEIAPKQGSTVPVNPPFLFASFDPTQAPLDLSSVRLSVDQNDVTVDTYVDHYLVFFSPSVLTKGKHECLLSGRTLGGNANFRYTWSFFVK